MCVFLEVRHPPVLKTAVIINGIICSLFRKFPLPEGEVHAEEADRVLPAADVHPVHPHRHPVLGLVLDQRGRRPRQDLPGCHHGPHHGDPTHGLQNRRAKGTMNVCLTQRIN